MKILFLTNNLEITQNLLNWLKKNNEVKLVQEKITSKIIKNYSPDMLISYNYKYIIEEDVITLMKNKIINLHIGYLPWNKGADPNFWSFVENTPKGVSIHIVSQKVDEGDILLQRKIRFNEQRETLKTSYHKLHTVIQALFKKNWQKIRKFEIKQKKQSKIGSRHKKGEFDKIKALFGNKIWNTPLIKLKNDLENVKY